MAGGLEALPTGVGGAGSPTLGPGGVERPFWSVGRGCEGRERSRVSPRGPGVVGRPSRRVGMGREALEEGWDRSGRPSGYLGGVGRARRG